MGTHFLRLPLPTDAPPVTTTDLDAVGAANEFQFGDPAACYSHADWAREQQAGPACNAAMRHMGLGRPEDLPAEFPSGSPSHQRPLPFRRFRSYSYSKGRLHTTTDAGSVLLVRQPSPLLVPSTQRPVGRSACLLNDEPIRIFVPLLMRPWVVQACQSTASCHLGTARTLGMLERFYYWWVGMSICTRWGIRNCLECQRRKIVATDGIDGPPSRCPCQKSPASLPASNTSALSR